MAFFINDMYGRPMELTESVFILLIGAAFIAGLIDSIAGGGGLIAMPALLFAGLPPLTVLGTNKLQGLFGTAMAAWSYSRKGHVNLVKLWPVATLSGLASALGAWGATYLPAQWLEIIMPIALFAIAIYFALRPSLSDAKRPARIGALVFVVTVIPLIGFYDGIFGPGTGSFFMLAYVALAGYGLLAATAHTKLLNFASNVGAFAVFAVSGAILWKIGLAMGVAQLAGAWCGSRLAMAKGARLIRPLLVFTSLAMALRLLLDLLRV